MRSSETAPNAKMVRGGVLAVSESDPLVRTDESNVIVHVTDRRCECADSLDH
jgi:hypothetical protein